MYGDKWRQGDWAMIDEDGYWYVTGRSDDVINISGKRTGPTEIEGALMSSGRISEAAVIGVPHESHGEEVKAVIALAPGRTLSEADVIAYCKERLAAYKYPRLIAFVESLPKGPTGKILKRELR